MDKDKHITICVGIKNRYNQLSDCLLRSYKQLQNLDMFRLSIFDCGSDDYDYKNIVDKYKHTIIYQTDIPFSRSISFNGAARLSSSEYLFLCDADMSLPTNFYHQYFENVSDAQVWFPICYSLYEVPNSLGQDGWWREAGFGMVGITSKNFNSLGGLDESIDGWGMEDRILFANAEKKFSIARNRCEGLVHHWHPKDTEWHKRGEARHK